MKKFSLGQYSQKATGGDDWQKKQKEQRKSMEAYTGFSYVYDRFMQDMPYEEWAVYIKGNLEENGIYSQLLLHCGAVGGAFPKSGHPLYLLSL